MTTIRALCAAAVALSAGVWVAILILAGDLFGNSIRNLVRSI